MTPSTAPTETDVLDAFAMEPDHGRATLDNYLRDYPSHASALVELSFELSRPDRSDRELSPEDEALVARAWERRRALAPAVPANPVAALAPRDRQALARDLGVKTQVVSLFREGRIAVETVPRRFLARFAERVGVTLDALVAGLAVPAPSAARSYKSDERPVIEQRVEFVRALRQSGASDAEIADLASDG